ELKNLTYREAIEAGLIQYTGETGADGSPLITKGGTSETVIDQEVPSQGNKTRLDLILDSAIDQGLGEVTIPVPKERATREYLQKVADTIRERGLNAGVSNDGVLVRGLE